MVINFDEKFKDLKEKAQEATDGLYAEVVTEFLSSNYAENGFVEKYCLSEEEQKELEIYRQCPEIGLLRSENIFLEKQISVLKERVEKNNKIIKKYEKELEESHCEKTIQKMKKKDY